jgi:hypothetical protein
MARTHQDAALAIGRTQPARGGGARPTIDAMILSTEHRTGQSASARHGDLQRITARRIGDRRESGLRAARVAAMACDDCARSDQARLPARPPREQQPSPGLSFGLIHPRPPPFTGGRLIVFAQATDADGRQ